MCSMTISELQTLDNQASHTQRRTQANNEQHKKEKGSMNMCSDLSNHKSPNTHQTNTEVCHANEVTSVIDEGDHTNTCIPKS